MKRYHFNHESLTVQDIKFAALDAFRGHNKKPEVKRFKKSLDDNCRNLFNALMNGTWKNKIHYIQLTRVNRGNGKTRYINSPSLVTRIYQHLFINIILGWYNSKDNQNGKNCKLGYGITAREKSKSVVKELKNVFYDRRDLNYYLVIDQRKCYEHVSEKAFRKAMKSICTSKWLVDFAVDVCYVNGVLPIGTPTSPLVHHILMLKFDIWIKTCAPFSLRYADDNFLAFYDKQEANQMKWRIQNFWWYELGIRAKSRSIIIRPMEYPHDFCGYIFHRNPGRGVNDHDKGYVKVRQVTAMNAKKCKTQESWAAYHGILQHADTYRLITKILKQHMNLRSITKNIKIPGQKLEAPNIETKQLVGNVYSIVQYEIRQSSKDGSDNWIKLLMINEDDKSVCEIHGNYPKLIQYFRYLETAFKGSGRKITPLRHAEFVNQGGWSLKGSVNVPETADQLALANPELAEDIRKILNNEDDEDDDFLDSFLSSRQNPFN